VSAARIGVFGGTFDPVHVAHVVAATTARHVLHLDRVLMVVANVPWQKHGSREITAAEDRYAMVEAGVAGSAGIEASRLELDRGGESYTADTLLGLREANPAAQLFVIVGDDVGRQLHTWQRADEVAALSTIVLVGRPGAEEVELAPPWKVERVEIPRLDLSSSDLRKRAAAGLPLDGLVPDGAMHWIRRRGLYARER
jgi:nicotinate-nucleotide adenylyltransferase